MIPVRINAFSILHTLKTLTGNLNLKYIPNFFAEKRKESAYFSDDFKFVKGFNFLSTFMIISFILNVKFKS